MRVCFLLLLLQLHVTEGCTLDRNGHTTQMTGYTGGSVLLPCSCTDLQTQPETHTWEKHRTDRNDWITVYYNNKSDNRFQLVNDRSPGNLSLLVTHLTEADAGDYRCNIKGVFRDVRLSVKGCTFNREVKTVTGSVGQSVLLSCSCSELQAKPHTLTWYFYIGSHRMPIFPNDETNHYTHRVQIFNDHTPGNLSLLVTQLRLQDVGLYRCEISNNQYKDIQLTVTGVPNNGPIPTPEDHSETSAAPSVTAPPRNQIIIICAAAAAGVLLLILGGVMYRKYGALRQRGTEEQTEQITQQRKNDCDVPTAAVNPQTKSNKAAKEDDVTYSTVVHSNTARATHTPVTSGNTAVYACIKTK